MSMLDSLASPRSPTAAGNMMSSNRALRSARDAVDAHHVWELDPAEIEDGRFSDRLDLNDVLDLRLSIEQNGQTVPILVRRHPTENNRYLLVYGRRRLEAIRGSDKVGKVRALIANLDDSAALRAQVSENTGRRDLSFIERALFAHELLETGFGTQTQVAEVLNLTRSAVSMSIGVVKAIGPDLARAIGPADTIGRPRWEALAKDLVETQVDRGRLCELALDTRSKTVNLKHTDEDDELRPSPSVAAFTAVSRYVRKRASGSMRPPPRPRATALVIDGAPAGNIRKTNQGIRLELKDVDESFADWLESQAQDVLQGLHDRWKRET